MFKENYLTNKKKLRKIFKKKPANYHDHMRNHHKNKHEEKVKHTNMHIINREKVLIQISYSIQYGKPIWAGKRDQKFKGQTYFIDIWVSFPLLLPSFPRKVFLA